MEATPRVWVVRGGNNQEWAAQVPTRQAVAIGWAGSVDVSTVSERDELRARMEEDHPGSGTPSAVGQVFRFAKEIQEGDFILTPEKATKRIHVTRCSGPYRFDPSVIGDGYVHVRSVRYVTSIERSRFPVSMRNTLGSTLTVFRADTVLPYLLRALDEPTSDATLRVVPEIVDEVDQGVWADEIEGQARGQILEALDEIEHHDFQLFVAGLLEALGYKVRVGRKGKDGGVDVLAFPDPFGLASPRIKVQTKNQKTTAGVQEVGYLHGILGNGEKGLFVCTGGFSTDAKNAPFVRDGRVALVDGSELLDLLLQHYEAMPVTGKALLPLRRVYVPEQSPST